MQDKCKYKFENKKLWSESYEKLDRFKRKM